MSIKKIHIYVIENEFNICFKVLVLQRNFDK